MAKAKEKKTVVIADLYRFGYDLMVVEESEEKARAALMKEYRKAYKAWNDGIRPTKEEVENANECIEINEMAIGEVEWR